MTEQSWDTSIIGIDPARHPRSVLVVSGRGATTQARVLDELRGWRWALTVVPHDTNVVELEAHALQHDLALVTDIRGTRAARRVLTRILPTVAVVPPRGRGRRAALLSGVGTRRDTTVLVVHDLRDTKLLRRFSGSALVRLETVTSVRDQALALAAVLIRAHAWQAVPTYPSAPMHPSASPLGATS